MTFEAVKGMFTIVIFVNTGLRNHWGKTIKQIYILSYDGLRKF